MFAARYDPTAGSKNTNNLISTSKTGQKVLNRLNKTENKHQIGKVNDNVNEDDDIIMHDNEEIENTEDNIIKEKEATLKRKRAETYSESEEEVDSESAEEVDSESEEEVDSEIKLNELKSESKPDEEEAALVPILDDDVKINNAHNSVLMRFKKVMNKQPDLLIGEEVEEEKIESKDVAPLPQLKLPKDKHLSSQNYKNQNLDWLTKPAYYDSSLSKPFTEFIPSIDTSILKNLKNEFKIENAFSVQITLIQELLKDINRNKLDPNPRGDYLINAATGSGKTLSYLIPVIQYINGDNKSSTIKIKDSGVQCIIIVPTKPLVQQVYLDTLKLTKGKDINVMALKSGGDSGLSEEKNKIKSNLIDILITTPGRLVEHLEYMDLKSLRFLIVDEADRLLNQNFQDWCDLLMNKIENLNNSNDSIDTIFRLRCIKIVLSATLTTNSEKLTHLRLFKPRLVVVNTDNTNELYQLPRSLDEKVLKISEKLSYFKPLILINFLNSWIDKEHNRYNNFGLIFTKSNESTINLNKLLCELNKRFDFGLNIACINSMMDNQDRAKTLKNFDANGGILICTDLLSRGINLTSIKFVINYDLPNSTKEYIHRIGRTARAGNFGNAITFVFGDNEFKWFKKIVYSGQQINRNNKSIVNIKFTKETNNDESIEDDENTDNFKLDLLDNDKLIYEECLKNL